MDPIRMEAMKRGGKVKAKPKKSGIAKKPKAGGVSQRVKQVQTVKVNINTGRGKAKVRKEKGKKDEKSVTQPTSSMFGYRLASSTPIQASTAIQQPTDTSKLDMILSKFAQQQEDLEKQKKQIEQTRDASIPTGTPAISSVFESLPAGPASETNEASAEPKPTTKRKVNIPIERQIPGTDKTYTEWSAGYPNPKLIGKSSKSK